MLSMGILNVFIGSQLTSQVSEIGMGISSISFQAIPWGGGHIPPSFPSIGNGYFTSSNPNPFEGWGASTGATNMPSTSTPFTLYGVFRSNHFPSSTISTGGNSFQAQWNPMQVSFPLQGMSLGGNPFLSQYNPMQGLFPLQGGLKRGNPIFPSGNQMGGGYPMFNQSQQGFTLIFGPSTNSSWKPSVSFNSGPFF
jgi:hypothetical protein